LIITTQNSVIDSLQFTCLFIMVFGATTEQRPLSAIVQARRLSLFGHIVRLPDKTDAKKILTASPWTTGGDHQNALIQCG